MQSTIAEKGTHDETFACSHCGLTCKVTETVTDDTKFPRTVPPGCHRFPSLTPAWKKTASGMKTGSTEAKEAAKKANDGEKKSLAQETKKK